MFSSAGADEHWDWEVSKQTSWFGWSFRELWQFRHLLFRLVKRDFLVNYQQTILGPLWVVLQPVLTLLVYVLVFNRWMGVQTGTDPVLFYSCGIVLWGLFSDLFTGSSFVFSQYNALYSKVYFPRLIIPFSIAGTHLLRFLIQLGLLFLLLLYYHFFKTGGGQATAWMAALPVIILATMMAALAAGLIFSMLTARYRDLSNIVHLGIRLFMFVTPVIYPVALVPGRIRWLVELNPLTVFFELFRYACLGQGYFSTAQFISSLLFILLLFFFSLAWFNKQVSHLIDIA